MGEAHNNSNKKTRRFITKASCFYMRFTSKAKANYMLCA
ncbi:hypothetical protein PESP_a2330 [Pseudoalteromonas espejiana DSM 9414]|nr:hypothetical protein PESP_a2330 [Pseudoalteromonas espejiana DSM 9414]